MSTELEIQHVKDLHSSVKKRLMALQLEKDDSKITDIMEYYEKNPKEIYMTAHRIMANCGGKFGARAQRVVENAPKGKKGKSQEGGDLTDIVWYAAAALVAYLGFGALRECGRGPEGDGWGRRGNKYNGSSQTHNYDRTDNDGWGGFGGGVGKYRKRKSRKRKSRKKRKKKKRKTRKA